MAFVIADRVRETTTTIGTGSVTLGGAYTSFQTFSAAIGNGNNTYYTIASAATGEWEVGIGTYSSGPNSLSRDTVLASSAGGAKVSFSVGSKDVFVTQPAERSLLLQSGGSGLFAGNAAFTANGLLYANATTTATTSSNLTFDGTALTLGGNPTLSAGTANGVAYLNGSKVLTTGSALTFDGTNLGVGGVSNTYSGYTVLTLNNAVNGPIFDLNYAGTRQATFLALTNEARIGSIANIPFTFYQNGSEQMRLTSTGLGIGTSSPGYKLDVNGGVRAIVANGTAAVLQSNASGSYTSLSLGRTSQEIFISIAGTTNNFITGSAAGDLTINNNTGNVLITAGGSATQLYLNTSGNLGIGTSSPAYKLDVIGSSRIQSSSGYNFFFQTSGTTARINYLNDAFSANISAAYRATDFTWQKGDGSDVLKLDSSGNLGLGVTPSAWNTGYRALDMGSGALMAQPNGSDTYFLQNAYYDSVGWKYKFSSALAARYTINAGTHSWSTAPSGTAGNAISFTQAMTLDASGNLLVGTTSGSYRINVTGADNVALFNSSGTAPYIGFAAAGTRSAYIQSDNSVGLLLVNERNTPVAFYTNNTERARITSTGNFVAGGSVALATNATDGFLYVPTCAGTPTGTPTAITGMAPIVVNTTNNKLYFYSGGAWRDAGP